MEFPKLTFASSVDFLEHLQTEYKVAVQTYSKQVFPLQVLWEALHTPSFAFAFELMSLKCESFRKCAAGTTEGLWTVFSIAYLEHLVRKTTEGDDLNELIQRARKQPEASHIAEVLEQAKQWKEQGRSATEWLAAHSDNVQFWTSVKNFFKLDSSEYVNLHQNEIEVLSGMDPESAHLFFLTSEETEIPFKVLARAYKVKIIIFSPEDNINAKSKYEPEVPGLRVPKLYLFKNRNNYHLLYSHAQLQVENALSEELYSTVAKKREIKSRLVEEIKDLRTDICSLVQFCRPAQLLIEAVIESVKGERAFSEQREAGPPDFFTDDLVRNSQLMMRMYHETRDPLMKQIASMDQEVQDLMADLQNDQPLARVFQNQAIFKDTGVCDHCQIAAGEVSLNCGHFFCRKCAIKQLKLKIEENTLFLRPDGETVETFICPMLQCFVRVSAAKIKEIFGSQFYAEYMSYVEYIHNMICCVQCKKVRLTSAFLKLCTCGEKICQVCYCAFLRSNEGYCSCGNLISEKYKLFLKTLTRTCSNCQAVKSATCDFTSVECDDHQLCEDCLLISLKNGRCGSCYRVFSQKELAEARSVPPKYCCFCQNECRGSRLSTVCGCAICIACAVRKTQEKQACTECFSCSTQLPEKGYNQLVTFLTKNEEPQVTSEQTCKICLREKPGQRWVRAGCGDTFHEKCFEASVVEKLAKDERASKIPCPLSSCRYFIPLRELKAFVSEDTYKQYASQFQRKCPKCQFVNEQEDEVLRSHFTCRSCKFCFCTACSQQYEQNHDPARCAHEQVQAQLRTLEQIYGPDRVAQCPKCKFAVLCEVGRQNVRCSNPECQQMFCANCSAPSALYGAHGRAMHRPDCKLYDSSESRVNMKDVCMECRRLGALCAPPKRLAVPRRFALGES